jgi:hypothetical protein
VSLLTVLFQACVGGGGSDGGAGVRAVGEEVVEQVVAASNAWTAYQIGRQAARYGHHRTAARVFSQLTGKVRATLIANAGGSGLIVMHCLVKTSSGNADVLRSKLGHWCVEIER